MRLPSNALSGPCRALALTLVAFLPPVVLAGDRVPGELWQAFVDPADAGFDPVALEAAHESWERLPSSAFLVIADGAVVASWGEVERRFMCHSVRKSFLSALYGIYWDRGELELNKTMADLGIDDAPSPLLEIEQQARILDLLKARSAVYHPAAYAGRTDSAPRGSIGPGQAFGYNNWDFNTLATILMQETGDDVFESFDEHFGQPLGMQDWRVSDGYYHYELDKSKYPAYPFRMSARDAARFGLLFTRGGAWGDERILSKHWVTRSTALYSIDSEQMGYGFMWWVLRVPELEEHGMVSALGVGNQMIAAIPGLDLVVVNRANTYDGERTPTQPLVELVKQVVAARTGAPVDSPELVPLAPAAPDPRATHVDADTLSEYVGEWAYPPESFGIAGIRQVTVAAGDGHLLVDLPTSGTFALYLQSDGTFARGDAWDQMIFVRDEAGAVVGLADTGLAVNGAILAMLAGDAQRAQAVLAQAGDVESDDLRLGQALVQLAGGDVESAETALRDLVPTSGAGNIESTLNSVGYRFLTNGAPELAVELFAVNTRMFPGSANGWDSLGEGQMTLGEDAAALKSYQRSLDLDPGNSNARDRMSVLRERLQG